MNFGLPNFPGWVWVIIILAIVFFMLKSRKKQG
jgi:hypothetical protein